MLTFPGLQDRMIVLATGLMLAAGLAFIINRLRLRADRRDSEVRQDTENPHQT